jgi:UDP-N-acetylglucosamine:LPS N-acetylglucosamine transferase
MVGDGRPRVLLLTADMGEGHNAAARAIAERIDQVWPCAEVRTLDVIALMAPGMPWLMRSTYRLALDHAPAFYQFFYDTLWHHRWFAWLSKRLIAAWCGWRLWPRLRRFQPDVVACTHPFGAAAMDRLRRVRRLAVPTATFVTDFAPHPFWVFSQIDLHFVMHDMSAPEARRLSAHGLVWVAAPPIAPAFQPRDHQAARSSLGLRTGAFVVLVTGGAWGVGTLAAAVASLLELGERIQVVAVCGRNQTLRRRLEALGEPPSRLLPLGFVATMPELMAAADAIVTNAGGVTSLEAFASARPVLLFDPIAGHGRANAAMMQRAGLALVCDGVHELKSTIAELIVDEGLAARIRAAELTHLEGRDLGNDLALLAAVEPLPFPPGRSMRLAVRTLIASAVVTALLFQGSWTIGTRLTPAARGSTRASGVAVIVVAGSLSPKLLRAVAATGTSERLALTFFVEGEDVATDRADLARLARQGFEIEAGTWDAQRDSTVKLGRTRAEFADTVGALREVGLEPAYVAEPCGRFSLVAVAATRDLHLRRVVFGQRLTLSERPFEPPSIVPGHIIELLVAPTASPPAAAAAVHAVAAAVRQQGLRALTLAEMDRPSRHRPRAAA